MIPYTTTVVELSVAERRELRKTADRSVVVAMSLGVILPPLAYVYVRRYRFAVVDLLTLNYLLFGIVIVPLHTRSIIRNARRELRAAGTSPTYPGPRE